MTPATNDVSVKWLLRIVGGIELLALPFIVFPMSGMGFIHDRLLGLGSLPDAPIIEYMARCLSAMYVLHGAVVFRISFDVIRFRPLLPFLGCLHLAFGITVLSIDLAAGLPWWWVMGEGPGIAVGGLLLLYLTRSAGRSQ